MLAEKPLVSIIIVSWNVAELLVECLTSLYEAADEGYSFQIIVVDNSSSDATVPIVYEFFPKVYLIQNRENYGFPYACNQAAEAADGEFLFFLNPDAVIKPGTIKQLVDFMRQNPIVGLVGPQLRYSDANPQSSRRRFPSFTLPFIESTMLERVPLLNKLPAMRRYFMADQPTDQAHPVDWLVGAAFMVRRKLWRELGGMDEGFFMYSEEMDFCRRVKNAGKEIWYLPEAVVIHLEGQSSRKDIARRHISFNTSKVYYYRKYRGTVYAFVLRNFLLNTYRLQFLEEYVKLLLGHKPELRKERLRIYMRVLVSKLTSRARSYHWEHRHQEICLLTAEYDPQAGGVGDYTKVLAQFLTEKARVRVMTAQIPPNGKQLSYQNKPSGELPIVSAEEVAVVRPVRKWNWSSLPQIAQEQIQHPSTILNIQYQTGAYKMHPAVNFLPLYLRWRFGSARPRVVTTFHDLLEPYLFPKAGAIRRWVTNLLALSSDAVVVTNPDDYQKLQTVGLNEEKLSLVPIGSNILPLTPPTYNRRNHWRKQLGIRETDFAIGYFGLLNRNKGLDTLLEAVASLKSETVKVVIIGGDTGDTDLTNQVYAHEIDQLIKQSDLEVNVIRTGYLNPQETSQALYAIDVGALPFRDGGNFRRGSLLAMLAHNVPLITTTLTAIRDTEPAKLAPVGAGEAAMKAYAPDYPNSRDYGMMSAMTQLLHQENVILVQPENPPALAEALDELRNDAALREKLRYGAMKLSKNFGWDKIAKSIREVYSAC